MWMVAAIAAALLALVLLALVLPLRLAVRIGTDPWLFDLRLAPFAGLLGWVRLPRRAPRTKAPKLPRKPSAAPRLPILRALPEFLVAVLDRIRIDRLHLDLRFGTGDPALTGQIYGWLMPLAYGVGATADLRIMPDFDRACLAGGAEVALRVTPLRLAGPLFRLWRSGRRGS